MCRDVLQLSAVQQRAAQNCRHKAQSTVISFPVEAKLNIFFFGMENDKPSNHRLGAELTAC